jgi:hypothetical protein
MLLQRSFVFCVWNTLLSRAIIECCYSDRLASVSEITSVQSYNRMLLQRSFVFRVWNTLLSRGIVLIECCCRCRLLFLLVNCLVQSIWTVGRIVSRNCPTFVQAEILYQSRNTQGLSVLPCVVLESNYRASCIYWDVRVYKLAEVHRLCTIILPPPVGSKRHASSILILFIGTYMQISNLMTLMKVGIDDYTEHCRGQFRRSPYVCPL